MSKIKIETRLASLGGEEPTRHRVYVVGYNTGWDSVTDIPCPVCSSGVIRWAEAGYVTGYRICDQCNRHFLAIIHAGLAEARPDGRAVLQLDNRYKANNRH